MRSGIDHGNIAIPALSNWHSPKRSWSFTNNDPSRIIPKLGRIAGHVCPRCRFPGRGLGRRAVFDAHPDHYKHLPRDRGSRKCRSGQRTFDAPGGSAVAR